MRFRALLIVCSVVAAVLGGVWALCSLHVPIPEPSRPLPEAAKTTESHITRFHGGFHRYSSPKDTTRNQILSSATTATARSPTSASNRGCVIAREQAWG